MTRRTQKRLPFQDDSLCYFCYGEQCIFPCDICGTRCCVWCRQQYFDWIDDVSDEGPHDEPSTCCKRCWQVGEEFRIKKDEVLRQAVHDATLLNAEWERAAKQQIGEGAGSGRPKPF